MEDALRLGRKAVAATRHGAVDIPNGELAMALVASGDLAGARALFDALGPPNRAGLPFRLGQEAALALAEGKDASGPLKRARAELTRSKTPVGEGDRALMRFLVGPWAEALLPSDVPEP